jgi:maltose O-acetyltransferase
MLRGSARTLLLRAARSRLLPRTGRWALLRLAGLDVGTRAIAPGCTFTGPGVRIARGSFINTGCLFDSSAAIEIETRCALGPRVSLLTSTHELGGPDQRAGALRCAPIRIGAGSWIGACATILPGVTVGEGCVIAAGAVVVRDCEPGLTYAGVPAKALRAAAGTPVAV